MRRRNWGGGLRRVNAPAIFLLPRNKFFFGGGRVVVGLKF